MVRRHIGIRRKKCANSAFETQNPPKNEAPSGIAPRPISAVRKTKMVHSPQANHAIIRPTNPTIASNGRLRKFSTRNNRVTLPHELHHGALHHIGAFISSNVTGIVVHFLTGGSATFVSLKCRDCCIDEPARR